MSESSKAHYRVPSDGLHRTWPVRPVGLPENPRITGIVVLLSVSVQFKLLTWAVPVNRPSTKQENGDVSLFQPEDTSELTPQSF